MLDEQAVLLSVINLLDNAVKYGRGTPVDALQARRWYRRLVELRRRQLDLSVERRAWATSFV